MRYLMMAALLCCLCECKDRDGGIDLSEGYPFDPVVPPTINEHDLPPIGKGE